MATVTDDAAAKRRERQRRYSQIANLQKRDIGTMPTVFNMRRRNLCEHDLERFGRTYVKEAVNKPLGEIHKKMIAKIQESVLHGALYAFAMPRGSGKSTWVRIAALWAISYAHSRYLFVIGANAEKAIDTLSAVKTWMRFLGEYGMDFPEIQLAVKNIGGIANRAGGQLSDGEPTLIEWAKDSITLPTLIAPSNLKGYKDELAPTSGSIISVSGLTGDGIRGSLKTLPSGAQLRPDFVLLDDPQTDGSANSATQNRTREKLVSGAVLGMAGPGEKISAVMPCTVIQPGDMVDNILDREKHALWRGDRTRLLDPMPNDMEAWEKYFEIYRDCAQLEPPNFKRANAYYKKNRKILDAGAHPTWKARKADDEVSAIQSAMNLYCRDPLTFFAEYQNEPLSDQEETEFLSLGELVGKQHAQGKGIIPADVEKITAFIDVQKELVYWVIMAFTTKFDGYIIDYGSYPEQTVRNFSRKNPPRTFTKAYKGHGLEARIYRGLNEIADELLNREWTRKDSSIFKIDRLGIDSRYKTSTVRRFWRDFKRKDKVTLTMGQGYGARKKPITQKPVKTGERKGAHWFYGKPKHANVRTLEVDVNWWKTFIHQRFATAINDPGCYSLYKVQSEQLHRLICEHLTSEYRINLTGPHGSVDEWYEKPGSPDNDFFDAVVGASAIASFEGIEMVGAESQQGKQRKKANWDSWGKK